MPKLQNFPIGVGRPQELQTDMQHLATHQTGQIMMLDLALPGIHGQHLLHL